MEHLQIVLFVFSLLNGCVSTMASGSCYEHTECQSCTSVKSSISSRNVCQWCPLDGTCHLIDFISHCEDYMFIKQSTLCPNEEERREKYDSEKGNRFALLSAVAYAEPEYVQKCLNHSLPGDEFELVEVIGRKCDLRFNDYEECFAYTAISHKRSAIILSYRGIAAGGKQLYDEAASTFNSKESFRNTGEAHAYFHYAFNKLYDPCIKESIRRLARKYSAFDVIVTGHSLGGAMASLAAVALVKDGVVPQNRLALYTYGMPRAGNKDFTYGHSMTLYKSWKTVHHRDMTVYIPPIITNAYHHGIEIYYYNLGLPKNKKSEYMVCTGRKDNECSKGVKIDFFHGNKYHTSYFGIDLGNHCKNKLRYRRSSEEPRFPDNHCEVISLKDAEKLANTEIKTVTESQCDFENDFCDWSRASGSTFNFQRHKGQTDAAGKTGPRTDCKGSDGYFVYVDAKGNSRELAKLRSPNFPMGRYCFEYWYHMYGEDMGTLKVWVFVSGMNRKLLKEYAKNQGKKWVRQQVNVDLNKGQNDTIHFEFEARIGNNFASDIALDDISIMPGRCI